MTFLKKISGKIKSAVPVPPRKKGRHVFRPQALTRQSYTPFQKKNPLSRVQRGLKRLGSFFSRVKTAEPPGRSSRPGNRNSSFVLGCLIIMSVVAIAYVSRGWVAGFFSGVEYFEVQDNVTIDGCHVTTPAEIREVGEIRYHTNLFTIFQLYPPISTWVQTIKFFLSSAMTGEVMYVDCGYNIMGY